jgi:2,3-bisphosphoglycerate-independent phosphoglycerate mutase
MLENLLRPNESKIVMLVMDGLGGIRNERFPETALERARTPNMDGLASKGLCGRSLPISYGITPGSGPAHLALFGYDPLAPENDLGRGVTEVTGAGFDLEKRDIAIRGNFATADSRGILTDRRAGRLPQEECIRICAKLAGSISQIDGVRIIVLPVREHRFGVVLRGDDLYPDVTETDPQITGQKPLDPRPLHPGAKRTAGVISEFIRLAGKCLADEPKANTVIMRGISRPPHLEPFGKRYALKAVGIAAYPLYRGVAKLCGMDILETGFSVDETFDTLVSAFDAGYEFFFVHIKKTDSYGEDGNIEGKTKVIEEVDAALPKLLALGPDVTVITGDHSTPCAMKSHSWHPVPFLISSEFCGRDSSAGFSESECDRGALGLFPATKIMELALANAGRLIKHGA